MSDVAGGAARLTPRQRECLSYVYDRLTSKEIAARIGLSSDTVDTYIKEAVAALGARNRRHAAELFRAATPPPRETGPQITGLTADVLADHPTHTPTATTGWAGQLPFRAKGSRGNDIAPFVRFVLTVFAIPIGIATGLGMLAIALWVLSVAYAGGTIR